MQRDWELIREILARAAEKKPGEDLVVPPEVFGDWDVHTVGEHIYLLTHQELVRAKYKRDGRGRVVNAMVFGIEWDGYDLLATLTSKPLWERIKQVAREKGIELSFDAVKALAPLALKWLLGGDGS